MDQFIKVTTLDDVEDGQEFMVSLSELKSLLEVYWGKKSGGTNGCEMEIGDYGDGDLFYIHLTQGGIALADKIGEFQASHLLVSKEAVVKLFPDF